MKIFLLLIIEFYWAIVSKDKRRKCIFRISCSHYVYQQTKEGGLIKGLNALNYRFLNCRSGFHIFEDPISGHKMMVLPNKEILTEVEISQRLIN